MTRSYFYRCLRMGRGGYGYINLLRTGTLFVNHKHSLSSSHLTVSFVGQYILLQSNSSGIGNINISLYNTVTKVCKLVAGSLALVPARNIALNHLSVSTLLIVSVNHLSFKWIVVIYLSFRIPSVALNHECPPVGEANLKGVSCQS